MKNKIFLAIIIALSVTSCVQKAYLKTVIITLTVSDKKEIEKVGIRGKGKPLSWNEDYLMKEVIKDSIYTATVTTMTPYKFGEIKFTINGEFELKDKPNRKIIFSEKSDTTYYAAVFDKN
jgi:hypothetical protein